MLFSCNKIATSDGFEKRTLAPTVPKNVYANNLPLEICAFLVIKSLHCSQDCWTCSRLCVRKRCKLRSGFEASQDGQIQVPVVQEHRVLWRLDLCQMKAQSLYFQKIAPSWVPDLELWAPEVRYFMDLVCIYEFMLVSWCQSLLGWNLLWI